MNKKNIFLLTEEFRPSKKGGIATWSYGLANYLSKEGYDVTVFVKKRHGIDISKIKKNIPYKICLMRGRDWAYFKKWYVRFAIKKFIKKANNPIIISSNWELSEGIIAFKKKLKFKLITILHGIEVIRLNSNKYIKRRKNFVKTLNKSDVVVSVSNYLKNQTKLISNKEIMIIHNFVNSKKLYPKKNIDNKSFNFSTDDRVILSLSRLVRRKGHHIVIKSLSLIKKVIPNIKYIIAGDGDYNYKKELEKLAKEMDLDSYIYFVGHVDGKRKNDLYNLCDIYVMNSLPTDSSEGSETFGITFLEANACGKPVVGTNVGGIPDAISNNLNGILVEPDNPEETAKAIIQILKNKKKYRALSKGGIERIKNEFDIDLIGEKYKLLIDKLYDSL
tara:strand:- start:432 stop:1598 length:1167 start_codon:yes stop_codon:yes gene_type:complete